MLSQGRNKNFWMNIISNKNKITHLDPSHHCREAAEIVPLLATLN